VGIEAPGGFDGLKYTYANIYSANTGILGNRKAVLFTTLYADSNSAPVIFSLLPSALDSVEIGQSVTFKADAFDFEGEDLDYLWYHRETLVGQGNICTINFEETGSDSVIVFVSDGVNQSEALWQFEVYSLGFVGNLSSLPLRFNLGPLHPNPFNPVLTINFALAQTGKVKISIYNIMGQKAEHLLDETLPSGYYQTKWNADVQASGIYLVRMETKDFTATKKVLLLK
jgi:hypothetical protein